MEIEYVNSYVYKDRDVFMKGKRLKNYIKKNNYLYEVVDYYPEDKPEQVLVLVYKIKGVTNEFKRINKKIELAKSEMDKMMEKKRKEMEKMKNEKNTKEDNI